VNPTGMGEKPDLLMAAGMSSGVLAPRPVRNKANSAAHVAGIVAEGHCDGEVDLTRPVLS
jgi:hypothetical protein